MVVPHLEECYTTTNKSLILKKTPAGASATQGFVFCSCCKGHLQRPHLTGFWFPGHAGFSENYSCCRDLLPHGSWWRGGVGPRGQGRGRISQQQWKGTSCGTQSCSFSLISWLLSQMENARASSREHDGLLDDRWWVGAVCLWRPRWVCLVLY